MDKKLPKVFANSLDRIDNNKTVFYSADDRNVKNEKDSELTKEIKGNTIEQKINSIFKATNYIYKADVEITLDSGTVTKRIIGKNNNNLITIDSELIPINKIIDIKYK